MCTWMAAANLLLAAAILAPGAVQAAALEGYWAPQAGSGASVEMDDRVVRVLTFRDDRVANLTNDAYLAVRAGDDLPVYRPEHWAKVRELDRQGDALDPAFHCMPLGLPRAGPPSRIVQTDGELFLFYDGAFQATPVRAVPIGERKHPVDPDGTWLGDPAARWDGDTLVIETVGFNDQTWLGPAGWPHGLDLKVTERFRPDGPDRLVYDVTVEDREFLLKPWALDTRILHRNPDPAFRLSEAPPCSERDAEHIEGAQRGG